MPKRLAVGGPLHGQILDTPPGRHMQTIVWPTPAEVAGWLDNGGESPEIELVTYTAHRWRYVVEPNGWREVELLGLGSERPTASAITDAMVIAAGLTITSG